MLEPLPAPEPGSKEAWKMGSGPCVVCGRLAHQRHHVIEKQHLKHYAPDRVWDLAGGIWLCDGDHARHTNGFRLVPLDRVPDRAVDFAYEILREFAPLYLQRRYAGGQRDPRLRRRPRHD